MTIKESLADSKLAREAYRKVRIARNIARATQAEDELPAAIIRGIIDPDDPEGLLDGPVIKANGMALHIPIWGNTGDVAGDVNTLELFIAKGHVTDPESTDFVSVSGPHQYVYPFADDWVGDFNVALHSIQPDGPFTFMHEVGLPNGKHAKSLIHVTSDIIAPYELACRQSKKSGCGTGPFPNPSAPRGDRRQG